MPPKKKKNNNKKKNPNKNTSTSNPINPNQPNNLPNIPTTSSFFPTPSPFSFQQDSDSDDDDFAFDFTTITTNIKPNQPNNIPNIPTTSSFFPTPSPFTFQQDSDDDDFPFDVDEIYDSDDFEGFGGGGGYGVLGYEDYYEQFDDYSNPFDPSYQDFTSKPAKKHTIQFVEDLDLMVTNGGTKTHQALLKLPLCIFLEIISRLPIKPLAVCRCVCKTWLQIVHHPRFTKLHYTKVVQQQKSETPRVFDSSTSVLIHAGSSKNCELHVLEHDKDESFDNGVLVNLVFINDDSSGIEKVQFELLGSCNGLVCLSKFGRGDPIYVLNPVIGECMTLPRARKRTDFEIVCGFGYDDVGNEYKVIRMLPESNDHFCSNFKLEVEIYTLGSREWRKLGDVPYPLFKKLSQVFFKGALHWMTYTYVGLSVKELIVAFDVGKEEFRVVPPPNDFASGCDTSKLHLGDLGGNLCLYDYSTDDRAEIWVMKEYGVQSSWTKEYVIPRKVPGFSEVYFKPMALMKNGSVMLLVRNESLVCYDPSTKCFKKLEVPDKPPRLDAITHVGSFLSLKDIVGLNSKPCATKRRWYSTLHSITAPNQDFDIEAWRLNEQLRRLWFENH